MCTLIAAGATGLANKKAFAATNQPQTTQAVKAEPPNYKASIQVNSQGIKGTDTESKVDESKSDAALLAKATVTKEQAITAATAAYPGYTVKDASLGDENGNLIYDVNMVDKNNKSMDVKIDAGKAKVLKADSSSDETSTTDGKEEVKSAVDTDNVNEQVEQ